MREQTSAALPGSLCTRSVSGALQFEKRSMLPRTCHSTSASACRSSVAAFERSLCSRKGVVTAAAGADASTASQHLTATGSQASPTVDKYGAPGIADQANAGAPLCSRCQPRKRAWICRIDGIATCVAMVATGSRKMHTKACNAALAVHHSCNTELCCTHALCMLASGMIC